MGAVDTTYTFTATDTITSAKMNNIIDQTTMTSSAIIGTTLEVASGQLKVRAQGITSNELASSSVTPAQISTGGPSWTASSVSLPSDTSVSGTVTATGFVGPLTGNVTGNVTGSAITLGTPVTASGSTITFGSLPSWIKRITVIYDNLSTNGNNTVYVRIGTGGTVLSTGYTAYLSYITSNGAADTGSDTTGFYMGGSSASDSRYGSMAISKLNSNIWVASSVGLVTGSPLLTTNLAGSISLGGVLDTLTLSCGANTFDTGTVNVMYE